MFQVIALLETLELQDSAKRKGHFALYYCLVLGHTKYGSHCSGVSSSIMQSRVYLSLAPRKKKHRTRLLSQRSSFYNYFKSFNCFISQFENSNQVPCSPKTEHSLVSFLVSCTTIRVFKFHIGHSSFRMMTWHVAASL